MPGGPTSAAYFRWKVGNSWTYRVTDPTKGVSMKVNTIDKMEPVGGKFPMPMQASALLTTKKGKGDAVDTQTWQNLVDGVVVRYREVNFKSSGGMSVPNEEVIYQPSKLRLDGTDAHTKLGASWTDVYSETRYPLPTGAPTTKMHADKWSVVAVDESVTVPKGTFKCLHLLHVADTTGERKEYWFARGVGKVKEKGAQTEELVELSVR